MLRRARRVLSHDTACLGVQCYITACSGNAVLRSGMLSEFCLARDVLGNCYIELRHARRVQSYITASLASAILRYGVHGKCCHTLLHVR